MSLFEEIEGQRSIRPINQDFSSYGVNAVGSSIFALDRVQFSFPGTLLWLEVSNNWLTMALETLKNTKDGKLQKILWIDLEVEFVPRVKQDQIRRIFLHPSARHLILSTHSGDNYYLYKKWKKPKHLAKFRGVIIESIAWERRKDLSEISTGTMLIGSRQDCQGHVFEAELQATDDFFKKEEKYFKQVGALAYIYTITDSAMPICGIRYEKLPDAVNQYALLMSTPERLYTWMGPAIELPNEGRSFEDLFQALDQNPTYQEIPLGGPRAGSLQFWLAISDSIHNFPKKYAWLTGSGIYHGILNSEGASIEKLYNSDSRMLPFPATNSESAEEAPIAFALSEFHFILLYSDRIKAICELNGELVFEEVISLEKEESLLSVTMDPIKGTFWIFTTLALYELLITDEDRDIWQLYLKNLNFEAALRHCKSDAQKRNEVLKAQADHYYNQKQFELAAIHYAQTSLASFEEISLKFLDIGNMKSLKVFLLKRLEKLKKQDITQTTLLTSWLIEIFINELNEIRFEKKWEKAIEFLSKQNNVELYYKFSGILFENAPAETVNLWMKEANINPRRLLPALLESNHNAHSSEHAIQYLNFVTERLNVDDIVVHNYLLSLYVDQAKLGGEERLLSFIASNILKKENIRFDLQYALRLCSRGNLTQSCIMIYSLLGLYEQAVSLALRSRDLELARINADKPIDDDNLRKKLWLLIAQYVIKEKQDIKQAINYLKHCELLKIEDILPCFPDFVLIDDFKDELCMALEDFNKHIESLKIEMDEATQSAENIRTDIKELRRRFQADLQQSF
ncbi:hypothetical protein HDU97_006164 [Phlyctochytrium planicorne]|nr:hypothetical protein HDU97_006164 [Phlyctochytrium planicorne]